VNAHERHPAAAHPGTRSPADADAGVGKQPLVPDDPVASAASHHHTVDYYKHRVGQFMADAFSVKHDSILTMQTPLARSKGNPPHSFLGEALAFAIGAAGGPFVDALEIGVVASAIVKQAIPALANAVGNSVSKSGPSGPGSLATGSFCVDYAHAVKEHHALVTQQVESAIHNVQDGKDIVGALGGQNVAGRLQLTPGQEGSVRRETQRETLDAWTVAMQKTGDKKDHNKQGYSDPSTGQLHLDSLLLRLNGTIAANRAQTARMEGVGNDAAQIDGDRRLDSIPVQRTMNVTWDHGGGLTGQFGMSISAGGHMAEDELGHDDKAVIAGFYDNKSLLFPPTSEDFQKDEKIIKQDYPKGLHKIWNLIKGQTPHQLGFKMQGD
jgi:hypothetical protein